MDNRLDYKQIFKRQTYVVTLAILLVGVILVGASYAIFMTESTTEEQVLTTGDIEMEFVNGNSLVNEFNPMSDIEALLDEGNEYVFSLNNTGDYESRYNITISNLATDSVDLTYIKYQYNDEEIGYLTDCVLNDGKYVIKSDYLEESESLTNQVLKIWVGLTNSSGDDFDFDNLGKEIKLELGLDAEVLEIPPYSSALLAGNDPVLNSGFVPVVIESDGTVKKADVYTKWFSYEDKEWANAVTVNSQALRNAEAGTEIPMDNIEEMYVWIPRYAYDVDTIVDAQHAIDITFVDTETDAHPAFTVEGTELKGMWVGKFEMAFKEGEDKTTANAEYVIKPNLNSVYSANVSKLFTNIAKINNTNEFDEMTDVHMIKNTEWGSVAYLW